MHIHSLALPADAGRYSTIAAACVPGDPAIQANRYFVTAASVKHRQGQTGLITVYCPIPPTITEGGGSFGGMFMTYTATGETANVTAQLLRVDQLGNFSPVVDSVTGTRAILNSGVGDHHYTERAVNHTYDFDDYYYYLRVDINRSDDSSLAILYGVGVDSLPNTFRGKGEK
jgi:hypothetical protein